jgi:hypothetical protein
VEGDAFAGTYNGDEVCQTLMRAGDSERYKVASVGLSCNAG